MGLFASKHAFCPVTGWNVVENCLAATGYVFTRGPLEPSLQCSCSVRPSDSLIMIVFTLLPAALGQTYTCSVNKGNAHAGFPQNGHYITKPTMGSIGC